MMQQIGMAWWRGDRGGEEKESSGARRKRQRGTDERSWRRNKSRKRKGLGSPPMSREIRNRKPNAYPMV